MDTLHWKHDKLTFLDQTRLPGQIVYTTTEDWQDVRDAIRRLAVRGAPAIGVAAAYAVVLAAKKLSGKQKRAAVFLDELKGITTELDAARPTAVNLHWALMRMLAVARALPEQAVPSIVDKLEQEALAIQKEDLSINCTLSAYGAAVLAQKGRPLRILTHCNAGALATAGMGTALGVIRALHEQGLVEMVYADETRPLLQGARLTAFELMEDHIPVTLITDNMAGWAMKTKHIDPAIVGADRITRNGDTANKIGTYSVSILAKELGIPFYVAAPVSTFDLSLEKGDLIPIEERPHEEVLSIQGVPTAPAGTLVFNPAFDVAPHDNIKAIFTELGVIEEPDTERVTQFFTEKGVLS